MSQRQLVKTACQLCVAICGMNVYLEDGKIVKVEGIPEQTLLWCLARAEGLS